MLLPIQSGRHAVQELEAAHAMGFRGLTIGTFAPGVDLDHPDLDGLWETCARKKMPIFLHPLYLYGEPRLASYDLPNAIGRVNDTAIAVSRLLYAGALTRHPDLQMIVAHGGGGVPYALGRLLAGLQELINLGLAILWVFLMYKAYIGERYRIPQLADLADSFSRP